MGRGREESHKPDDLIRELTDDRSRNATPEEIDRIIHHIANAPFDRRVLRVPAPLRGRSAGGYTLGRREDSLITHFVQRVAVDEQWSGVTTEGDYLRDLYAAVNDPSSRLAVFGQPGGEPLAVVFSNNVVPAHRRGSEAEDHMFVVYATELGAIITGYQVSGLQAVRIPPDVRWLK